MKKRLISLLLAFSMMLTFLPAGAVSAFAEENSHTYNCGENVTATLSRNSDGEETYTLTITGEGPMANYDGYKTSSNNSCAPWCEKIQNITQLIVGDGVTTLGDDILYYGYYDYSSDESYFFHPDLHKVKLPDGLTYIGKRAFCGSPKLIEVEIPSTVTKIEQSAFSGCTGLTKIELPPQLEEIGYSSFYGCSGLTEITIPSSVKIIRSGAFEKCYSLESVTLSEGIGEIGTEAFEYTKLKSLNIPKSVKKLGNDIVRYCQHLAYITIEAPSQLEEASGGNQGVFQCHTNVYCEHRLERLLDHFNEYASFITKVDVTLVDGDQSEKKKINYGADITALDTTPTKRGYTFAGWYTDADCKTRYPDAQLFTNINGTTLYAGWKFDPDALVCRSLTVTGGTVTVKYDGSDVTNTLTVTPDEATGKKTYDVPEGAEVTVTLDKTAVPNGKVFDGWSTSLPTGQDYKAERITFTMNSDVDIAAQYRDAATDHTPDTAVCHPLTVTGGIVTVKNGDKDVTDTLTVTTDETTGKKTYSVPDGAIVTVTLDKTLIPEGMVFDIWSTGKFSLPLGQDYKAESITFTMNSDVDIAAQYRDAATDHTPDTAVCHPLTVTGGIVTVKNGDKDVTDTLTVTTDETTGKKTYSVPDGAIVTVTLDKTLIPEGMVFDIWSTGKFSLPLGQDYKAETITFPMSSGVDIAAQYRDATIEDDGPDIVGPIVIGTTVVVGGAVLGYQAYSLGAEFAGKLMALPYFPSNRSALAMMLWEDAGKPMPESELLYPDVGQEERDMDLQHAARWAMENDLVPDLNDEGTAPEEMKFYPDNAVSKIDVLKAWQKAQELKQNA